MRGNRDFLLGTGFAHAAGATLLDDSCLVQAFGQRIVLAHGDSLCTLDHAYQNFRRLTRNRAVQAVFLAAPLPWRLALARHLRRRSAMRPAYAPQAPNPRWDVTTAAVDSLLQQWHADTLIHGHTHRPAHHRAPERWVLPDWELDHGAPRGGYLRLDAQGLRMCALDRA